MPPEPNQFLGHWRITGMEKWDRDYLDLVVPAYISFDEDDDGAFQFGTVRGWLDCEFGERDGQACVEFSWQGFSDDDEACGRGWALLTSETVIEGRLYIHTSDSSSFIAHRRSN